MALPRAIAILGPTGSGKSAFAMRLAAELPVEIISVDSAQVYRGMDIGTAKPSAGERSAVPHHLIDIREPEQGYSAGEFRADCLKLLEEITARGRVPLLVGGTMLYFRSLFQGIAEMPIANPELRAAIDARARIAGWPALHAELAVRDPESAARIHTNDAQRIQRALEVLELSGRTLREHWNSSMQPSSFCDWHICMLQPTERSLLHAALTARLDAMVTAGFPEEVSKLLARSTLSEDSAALRLVGYRQMIPFCRGQEKLPIAVQKALHATRQLAKRQMTWLRSSTLLPDDSYTVSCDPFDAPTMEQIMRDLIKA
ncbi:MAG: tRNA (adenosine(37)-N6)-dimethylallyltransferase MiaA, partial [Pseudomonadota bacterium]